MFDSVLHVPCLSKIKKQTSIIFSILLPFQRHFSFSIFTKLDIFSHLRTLWYLLEYLQRCTCYEFQVLVMLISQKHDYFDISFHILLILHCSRVSIVDFEQVNAG